MMELLIQRIPAMHQQASPSDERGSWLCPTPLDRARLQEMEQRLRPARTIGYLALMAAAVVLAPSVGWWLVGLLALLRGYFWIIAGFAKRLPRPELASAAAFVLHQLVTAVAVAASGGATSPLLPWFAVALAGIAARFRTTCVLWGTALTLVMMGAAAVLPNPSSAYAHPQLLVASVALIVNVVALVITLLHSDLHHRRESTLDPLTGLLNRHSLERRSRELEEQAALTGAAVCLVMGDLDHFKAVNDGFGHDVGDAVLRDVGYLLRKHTRHFELVYRLGGEEVLVVLPGLTELEGARTAERLREEIEQSNPGGQTVTMSMGVAAAAGPAVSLEGLLKEADTALYQAKRMGRNRVVSAREPAPLLTA